MVGGKAAPLEPDILTDEVEPKPLDKSTEPEPTTTTRRRGRGTTTAPAAKTQRAVPYNFGKIQAGIARGMRGLNVALATNPITKGDRFDDVEVLLVSAIAASQAEHDLWLRRIIMKVLDNGGRASIGGLILIIAARRAARHGILPADFDYEVGQFLNQTLSGAAESIPPLPPEPGIEAVPSEAAPNGVGG